jgi:Glycosyl transferase family 2
VSVAVSIVIDNHNYGRFLAAAIDSVLAQDHDDVQIVVVDDGSTDESREVIAGYGSRVEAVLKANGGQASAMNAGFARCTGDVVIFLDSDDALLPEAARRAADAFAAHPDAVKVQLRMEVIDRDGRRTGILKPDAHLPMPCGDVRRDELSAPFDLAWMPTSANAFSARALRRILPIPEEDYRLGADWYLQHVTPLLGEVVSLDAVAALYRVHGGNGYEQAEPVLDLEHVRQSIHYAATTSRELERWAAELGLDVTPGGLLSVSDLGNRLISRRLGPARHPLAGDRTGRLVVDGIRAARSRLDLPAPARLLFAAWFVLTALAPASAAVRLAELFLFPARRRALTRLVV